MFLGFVMVNLKVGYYFVENQYGIVFVINCVQVFKKFVYWWNIVYVIGNWFNDNIGDIVFIFGENCFYVVQVVKFNG